MISKISRRNFLKTASLSMAGITLAACAPKATEAPAAAEPTTAPAADKAAEATQPAEPTTAPASAEKVELRFGSWDSESGQAVYTAITEGFNKISPNVTVKIEFTPDSYEDKILTGLAGGNAPDIYMWWNFPDLWSKNGMLDLTELAALPGDEGLDLSKAYATNLSYLKINGKLVGTPNAFTPRALYYNKALFKAAGIAEPTNDWTTDDLMNAATKLTQGDGADKVYGFLASPGSYVIQPYLWSNGTDWISADGKTASGYTDSKETIEIVQWLADMVLDSKVSPSVDTSDTLGGATQMFMNGKLAMMDNGRWPLTDLKAKDGFEFGIVLPPSNAKTKKRVTLLHNSGFCINPNTKNKEAAWQFAKYIGGPQGNKEFGSAGWAMPAYEDVVQELGWDKDEYEKVWVEATPLATVPPCFLRTTVWDQVDSELANTLESIWLGEVTAEAGLTKVAKTMDDLLANAPSL